MSDASQSFQGFRGRREHVPGVPSNDRFRLNAHEKAAPRC
jgi:hypothetical protein